MNLKDKILSGIRWTSISSIGVAMIQLAQLVVLTHYLEPSDFGLMAIVGVIIGFSNLFLDFGISAFIIHKQDITHQQLSSLYWLNITIGIFLFISVYNLAPFLAIFFKENELVPIIRILAFNFLLVSISAQYTALFQKALKFNLMAKISILSVGTGFIVAVFLAISGFKVYALVYASLTVTLVGTFINVFLGLKEHRPLLIYKHHEITSMLSFGLFQIGEKIINYFNSQFDIILIGRIFGTELLGIYTVAKNLSMYPANLINPIITKVTFPIMAQLQNDTLRLKETYLKIINYLSSVNFPIYILLVLLAEPIILILFGEKWRASVEILQILLIYAAIRSTGNPIGSLQLAKGRADLGFYWNVGIFFLMPISIYFGSNWGVIGVAYSLLYLMLFLLTVPNWYFMVKPLCGAGFKEYFWQILKPLVLTIISGIVSYGTSFLLSIKNMILDSVIIFITMSLSLLILNILFHGKFINTLSSLLKVKKINLK